MSVYNCILGRPFATTLDTVASSVHPKLKYHNVHDKSVMISAGLSGVKRIYKDFNQD